MTTDNALRRLLQTGDLDQWRRDQREEEEANKHDDGWNDHTGSTAGQREMLEGTPFEVATEW